MRCLPTHKPLFQLFQRPYAAQLNNGKIRVFSIPLKAVKASKEDFYFSSGLKLTTVLDLMPLSKPSASRCRCELFPEFPVSSPEFILTFLLL
jgi:hypothetical protein